MAVAAARGALLRRMRVAAGAPAMRPAAAEALFFFVGRRGFSEEVKGSFLDKGEVTDRVISVIKNFQKVDPSKKKMRYKWKRSL